MDWYDQIMLWDHVSIKVLDIRHKILRLGEELRAYRLPASGFLYTISGSAQIRLDGLEYETKRFHVLHGGKGMSLDIVSTEEVLEYYLIFYKERIPLPCRQEILSLLERTRPFHIQYGFAPQHPISLFTIVEKMTQEWRVSNTLERFHVNVLFYQFVYELFQQLQTQGIHANKPNPVAQTLRYIHEYYMEPLTLDQMAQAFNYSAKNLSKVFKKQTGYSLIDYVIQVRINKAKNLLLQTDATIKEIAESIGYPDRLYFTRIFKKHTGVTPGNFKEMMKENHNGADRLYRSSRSSIVSRRLRRYIGNGYDNHYQCEEGNNLTMHRDLRFTMAASLLFCFSLLMSACSTGAVSTNSKAIETQIPSNQESTSGNAAEVQAQTRVISTIKGDIIIPADPQRIVVDLYLGSFIALNVKPVGTPELNLKNPYFAEALAGVENIGEYESVSLEKILALKPDMIVTGNEESYEQYSKIAPTILVPYGELKNSHEEITYFGEVLGKEDEAKAWLIEYDARIAAAREKVEKIIPADATFSIMQDWGKTTGVFGDNFGRGGQAIYQALSLKPPVDKAEELMKEQLIELSEEVLSDYAGDYIILTSDTRTLADLKSDGIWKTLDAVKNNHVYIWKQERSWYFDPIATLSQTEELAAWLVGEQKE